MFDVISSKLVSTKEGNLGPVYPIHTILKHWHREWVTKYTGRIQHSLKLNMKLIWYCITLKTGANKILLTVTVFTQLVIFLPPLLHYSKVICTQQYSTYFHMWTIQLRLHDLVVESITPVQLFAGIVHSDTVWPVHHRWWYHSHSVTSIKPWPFNLGWVTPVSPIQITGN